MKENSTLELDRIDRRILGILQEEGRITNQQLADRVGLSPSACSRRVQILENAGIIERYGAFIDTAALGYGTTVILRITLEQQTEDYLSRFEEAVQRAPQIVECLLMSGVADYQLRVLVRSPAEYERLHKEVVSKLPGIARIESNFALRVVAQRQALPISEMTFR
jgi:Lrp/AsnC family transcriptional regulator, leucine-responsive regulatory protein